jgi:hypothetical protein
MRLAYTLAEPQLTMTLPEAHRPNISIATLQDDPLKLSHGSNSCTVNLNNTLSITITTQPNNKITRSHSIKLNTNTVLKPYKTILYIAKLGLTPILVYAPGVWSQTGSCLPSAYTHLK